MKYLLSLTLMFLSVNCWAQDDQIIIDGGVGVFHSADKGLSETKMLTLGVQEDLWYALKMRGTGGGWIDNAGNGRTGSALVSGQLGYEVNSNGLVGSVFCGPTLISHPDQQLLGGYFEFMEDLHLGIQDEHGSYIGIMYRHISDAGLTSVNIGRDIIGLEIRW